uniref:FAR1 domain-containing protein n=1 Tax=Schistocephalus solidus TaxID=70667 RepID=A0A0X3NNR5_SCHSO
MLYNNPSTCLSRRLGCDAFFNIIHHKEGVFVVTSFKAEHNHGPFSVEPPRVEPSNLDHQLTEFRSLSSSSPTTQNQTEILCVLFKRIMNDGIFDSYTDLLAKVKEYEQVSNTKFKRRLSVKLPEDHPRYERLKYRYLYFACHHSGKFRTESLRGQANSLKVGCRARFTAMQLDGQLHVKALYTAHNHPCIRKFLSAYAKFRRLDREKEKGVAGLISQLQPSTRRFKVYFQNHYAINYAVKDLENMHRRLYQSGSVVSGENSTLLDLQEDNDSDIVSREGGATCRYPYHVGSNEDMSNIARCRWTAATGRADFHKSF